jgi:GT2 family glycosyltransferase
MSTDNHRISVIIPTSGRATLAHCRAALTRQTRAPDEVIVVVDHQRHGAAWARNEGLRQATGDLIAFTDDDCVPPPNWLEQLTEAIDRHDAAGVGGTYQETDPFLHEVRQRRGLPDIEQCDTTGLVGTGGNVMYRWGWLATLAARDGFFFDPTLTQVGEDVELAWRVRRLGGRLVFVPNKVVHLRRMTPLSYLRLQFARGTGIARLYKLQRTIQSGIALQESLIWGESHVPVIVRWLRAAWLKVAGPFDVASFQRKSHFLLFWLGEKIQGAGFLWGLWRMRAHA